MLLRDAEIFAAGQWPGGGGADKISFSEGDLDGMVSAFNTLGLGGRVPLKAGHDGDDPRERDNAPALGWVQSIRREGGKLLADIKLTSQKLIDGIRDGSYKFVSVELLRNVQAHSRQIPWVLDAVAILGATAPAVGTLKELVASMQLFSRRGGLRLRGERLAFERANVNPKAGVKKGMEQAEVQALVDKAVAGASTKFTGQIDELKKQLDTANAETAKAKAQAHRQLVLSPLDAAIKDGTINAAAKDQFVNTFKVGDDEAVLKLSAKSAEEFIDGVKDIAKFKGVKQNKRTVQAGSEDDPETFRGKPCAEVLKLRVDQRVLKIGGKINCFEDLERASAHVLATEKDLAEQYFADQHAPYEPKAATA